MNELLFSNLKTIKGYTSNNAAGQMVVTTDIYLAMKK